MAEARRCDRCNEFYSINDDIKERGEYPITANYKKLVYSMTLYDNNVSRIKHLDLCPKCSRSLIVWLNDYCDIKEENILDKLVETDCSNCKYDIPFTEEVPCNECDYKYSKFKPKEAEKTEKPEVKEIDVRDNAICKTCKFHKIPIFERPCSVCNNYDMYSAQVAIAKAEEVLKNTKEKACEQCKHVNVLAECEPCSSCYIFNNFEPKEDSE